MGNTTTQYAYDATGNRTSKTIGATTYANTVSPTSNRLTQTQDITGTAAIVYDAAGHIMADGANTFSYSDRGRMATASNAGGTVNYLYNALNLRVAKTGPTALIATGASYYVFDEAGQLLGEYDANNTPIYETIYLGNTPVGVMKQTGTAAGNNIATSVNYVYPDHLNTARVITRAADNAMLWRWDNAEAFGATAANENPSALGTFTYNPRFPGQVFDSETGLNQNWNREYDPRQGRYRQSDPIGLAGGINTYSYVEGNPLMFIDPEGLAGKIPKGFGANKPLPPPGQLPKDTQERTRQQQERHETGAETTKNMLCYLGLRNCEAEDELKKARMCLLSQCTTCDGATFTAGPNAAQSSVFDPKTTTCKCIQYGFDPSYRGGPPPGLTPPGR